MSAADPRRVALVISSLGAGGAERVISTLANQLVARGRPVDLITMNAQQADAHVLDDRVRRVRLDLVRPTKGTAKAVWQNLHRVLSLSEALRASQPAVVVSFVETTNVLTILSAKALNLPVVVSERTDPREYSAGPAWDFLRLWTYPAADALVVQTNGLRPWGESVMQGGRVHVIPNPVSTPRQHPAPKAGNLILAMGRLVPVKGFDLLMRAFSVALRGRTGWRLVILGEGPERQNLTLLSHQLGIADRVQLYGFVSDPGAWLSKADLFVLSSRYEGYPNALLEAMAHGLPVISTDCRSGPAEIIRNRTEGLLVPIEVNALAHAMAQLMDDPTARMAFGEASRIAVERNSESSITSMWYELLDSLLDSVD